MNMLDLSAVLRSLMFFHSRPSSKNSRGARKRPSLRKVSSKKVKEIVHVEVI